MTDIVERIQSRPHDAPMPTEHLLDEAAEEIERLRNRLEKLHDCAPNALFYQEQAEYWRDIAREDRAEVERLRATLEIIAGSADMLQALQARAALDNIGAKV